MKRSSSSRSSMLMLSVMRIMAHRCLMPSGSRYCFASTLPSSTAGWSNASTPSRCAAMIVSSMKCISSSPRLVSSSVSRWMVRTGQPFLASVSAVARPLRGDEIADGLAGEVRLARELRELGGPCAGPARRADRDDGEQLVARAGDEQLQLAVLVDRPERADRRRALAVLAEALGPELHVPAREALEPVGIGHQHRDLLARGLGERDRERGADRGRHLGGGLPARAPARAPSAAPARIASMSRPSMAAGSSPTLVSTEKRPPTPGSCSSIATRARRAGRAGRCACRPWPAR